MKKKEVFKEESLKHIPKRYFNNIVDFLLDQTKTNHNISFTPHSIFQYYKNFQLAKRLRGTALSLLKTQYAKFPVDHGRRKCQ